MPWAVLEYEPGRGGGFPFFGKLSYYIIIFCWFLPGPTADDIINMHDHRELFNY